MISPRPTQSAMDQAVKDAYEDGFSAGLRHAREVVVNFHGVDGKHGSMLMKLLTPRDWAELQTWIREEKGR